jgi:hypothetical protein
VNSGFSEPNIVFNVGSGDDTLSLMAFGFLGFGASPSVIDFGSRMSGTLEIDNFVSGRHTLSFDGLDGISSTSAEWVARDTTLSGGRINDNTTYVVENGDAAVSGVNITNYLDLGEVSAFLNALAHSPSDSASNAVFVINNGSTSGATGDAHDSYYYLVSEDGAEAGISTSEITLIGMSNNGSFLPAPITTADIV